MWATHRFHPRPFPPLHSLKSVLLLCQWHQSVFPIKRWKDTHTPHLDGNFQRPTSAHERIKNDRVKNDVDRDVTYRYLYALFLPKVESSVKVKELIRRRTSSWRVQAAQIFFMVFNYHKTSLTNNFCILKVPCNCEPSRKVHVVQWWWRTTGGKAQLAAFSLCAHVKHTSLQRQPLVRSQNA